MSESQVMFVTRGRTVVLDGVAHPPGTRLSLPHDEAEHLLRHGFVGPEAPVLPPLAQVLNPAAIGRHGGVQGPSYGPA